MPESLRIWFGRMWDWWLERLGYVYISCIYLFLLILAIAISLNGYPIALVIFGLGGMVVTGYGLIKEGQGRSSFFRIFVERHAKTQNKESTNRTTDRKFKAVYINKLYPSFIGKFSNWLITCMNTNHCQKTKKKSNPTDNKQDAQELPHNQPPQDEK